MVGDRLEHKKMIIDDSHTYRQTKLLKSRFDKRCVLTENLLQISPSVHVSQNYRDKSGHTTDRLLQHLEHCVW